MNEQQKIQYIAHTISPTILNSIITNVFSFFLNTLCGVTFVPENRKITCPFRNLCSFLASSGVPDLPPAASFWE